MKQEIKGYRPSMSEAIKAMCSGCTARYADGRVDCLHTHCPFYSRMPYRKHIPNFMWVFGETKTINGKLITPWSRKYINDMTKKGIRTKASYIKKVIGSIKHYKIPMPDMIRAKCFLCMGGYYQTSERGKVECDIRNCPIYYWTPYRAQLPLYDWMFELNHTRKHRIGLITNNITKEEYIERLIAGVAGEL